MNLNDENDKNNEKTVLTILPNNNKPQDFGDESDIKIPNFNILANNDEESDDKEFLSSPKKHSM